MYLISVGTGPAECEECFCGIYHLSQIGEDTGLSRWWWYITDGVTRTCEKDKCTYDGIISVLFGLLKKSVYLDVTNGHRQSMTLLMHTPQAR